MLGASEPVLILRDPAGTVHLPSRQALPMFYRTWTMCDQPMVETENWDAMFMRPGATRMVTCPHCLKGEPCPRA